MLHVLTWSEDETFLTGWSQTAVTEDWLLPLFPHCSDAGFEVTIASAGFKRSDGLEPGPLSRATRVH